MAMAYLQHVPTWVFFVFAALLALGIRQSFPRSVALGRVAVLPVVLLVASLAGVVSSFGAQPLALPAWAAGVAAALGALRGRIDVSSVRWLPVERRFVLPGSWMPLALMMGLFALKFGVAAALARQPALAGSAAFALSASAAYGLFTGTFAARAAALWPLARHVGTHPAGAH